MKTKINSSVFTLIIILFSLLPLISCKNKTGDPDKYTEVSIENITEKNIPKGLMLREGNLYPDKGFEFVTSKDSTKVMLIQTGKAKGFATHRCNCQSGYGLSCLPVKDIIECSRLLCAKCTPLLIVYDDPIAFDKAKW